MQRNKMVRAEHKKECLTVRLTKIEGKWAWTATISGKHGTYVTRFFDGFMNESAAIENFIGSIIQLMAGYYSTSAMNVIPERMEELLEQSHG